MNRFYKIACALLALTILVSFYTGEPTPDKNGLVENQGGVYAASADLDVESEIALPDIESDKSTASENTKPYWENIPSDFDELEGIEEDEIVSSEPPKSEQKEPENKEPENKEENVSSQPEKEESEKEPDSRLPVTPGYVPYMDEDERILLEGGYPVRLQHTDPTTLKFAMQENNPAPVRVSDLKTNVRDVSFAYELLEGEEIKFEVYVDAHLNRGGHEADRCIGIIDSYQGMQKMRPYNAPEKYNAEYFEENALIMMLYVDGYCNTQRETRSITIKDGLMCIYVKNIFKGDAGDTSCSEVYLEISKEDLAKARTVVVYEEKIAVEKDGEISYIPEYIDSCITFPV